MQTLAKLSLVAVILGAGAAAQAQPSYTTAVKQQIKAQLGLPAAAQVLFSSTRMYHPPAIEKSRLYENRAGKYTATYRGWTAVSDFSFNVYRSGRVKVAK